MSEKEPVVDGSPKEEKVDPPKKKGNKNKTGIIVAVVLGVLLVVAAVVFLVLEMQKKGKPVTGQSETDVKEVYSKYRMSGNGLEDFDLRFLQLENKEENVVYSPLSIKYALAMLKEGASGKTKAQIEALIGDYQAKKYANNEHMSFANAMFIRNTYQDQIAEKYQKTLQDKYYAEVIYDAFENPNNINAWIGEKTFHLIENLVDSVDEANFFIINALAIDMEWKQRLQLFADSSERNPKMYHVTYQHESYSDYIGELYGDDDYGTVKFNDRKMNAKASEIGASLNNYDIVTELGEENIHKTITEEYTKWLAEDPEAKVYIEYTYPNGYTETDITNYVNKFIEELDSNYKSVKASTDFKFHVDDDVKVFSKELEEYDGMTLEYIGIMPRTKSLSEFVKETDAKRLNEIIGKLKDVTLENVEKGKVTKITGGIPLFNYEYKLNLQEDLKDLGVTDIFEKDKIDLSNMTEDKNITMTAAHQAKIEFSNDGIKAGAATALGGLGGASGPHFEHLYEVPLVVIDLNFDNPYLYLIRDKDTKEVWFVGTVYQPIENPEPSGYRNQIINE